jgi:hypothetical protein
VFEISGAGMDPWCGASKMGLPPASAAGSARRPGGSSADLPQRALGRRATKFVVMSRQTSLISLLSTEHGRLRREQRDIDKRDLQAALKHGEWNKCWTPPGKSQRWKIKHDGIIFVTDGRREITCYPMPLASAPLSTLAREEHDDAKRIIAVKPELCASHTVLVVDSSGSMATHDINLHRDRSTAAYSNLALEFCAEQLFAGSSNNKDVVSLVEFRHKPKVVFKREPMSWVLYNKIIDRRDRAQAPTFLGRQAAKSELLLGCHEGNYLPALEAAEKLLSIDAHDTCALQLVFLSDGEPSDARSGGLAPLFARKLICERVAAIATKFSGRLNIATVGFGDSADAFDVLKAMATSATDAPGDTSAQFFYCAKLSHLLGNAFTSVASSLTETRTSLLSVVDGSSSRTKREVNDGRDGSKWDVHRITRHFHLNVDTREFVRDNSLPPGAGLATEAQRRNAPPYLAIQSNILGQGAERIAFRCNLSVLESSDCFTLGAMVAKETNTVELMDDYVLFHEEFCYTQSIAEDLAKEFNSRLSALPGYDANTIPRLTFLPCSVLEVKDDSGEYPNGKRYVLVEKMLNTDKYPWHKWNSNAGAVDGRVAHVPMDVKRELAKLNVNIGNIAIVEGDSDEEEPSDEECVMPASDHGVGSFRDASPSDYVQAFTHFTYKFTNRKLMVCDLQGCFVDDSKPPVFELTDPAIHYASRSGRKKVFGRTDLGRQGMNRFFETHKCTPICKLMQIGKMNRNRRQRNWGRVKKSTNVNEND